MSGEGWQIGDLALCVDDRPHEKKGSNGGLVRGRIYTVQSLYVSPPGTVDAGKLGLTLVELPITRRDTRAFRSWRFVKVTPTEADDFDREIIGLLTGAPAKEAA